MRKKILFLAVGIAAISGWNIWLAFPPANSDIGHRFDSPDETANYFFAQRYAQNGTMLVPEPLNGVAENQIHPRSVNVASGSLVPGSFIGLPLLYGQIAKVLGDWAIVALTPILAGLAVLAFFGIVRRIFDERIAFLSAILLVAHPVWWYYTVRGLLPNVAFVSLLILGVYGLLRVERRSLLAPVLAGVAFGLAISIRPAEIFIIAAIGGVTAIAVRRQFTVPKAVVVVLAGVVTLAPVFFQHQILYGSWLSSGYNQLETGAEQSCNLCATLGSLIMPFGFHPASAVIRFTSQVLLRLWPWALAAIVGLVVWVSSPRRMPNRQFVFVGTGGLISFFLLLYYGSWDLGDPLTLELNTLGIAYHRYWLPIYLVGVPFIAISLRWIANLFYGRWSRWALGILVIGLCSYSGFLTLSAKPDSLLPVRRQLAAYQLRASEVNTIVEPDAVLITVRKDKVFFPDRKVIHTLSALSENPELRRVLPALVEVTPVYYYALGPEPELLFDGVSLTEIQTYGLEVLYQVNAQTTDTR